MKQSDYSSHLNATILEAVDTQLRDGTPPITRTTLERLKNEGHSEAEAKRLIGAALVAESVLHGLEIEATMTYARPHRDSKGCFTLSHSLVE